MGTKTPISRWPMQPRAPPPNTTTPWATVNVERLSRLLDESASIGRDAAIGEGLYRTALSVHDMAGRKWLTQTMTSLGLEVYEDGAMNIHGRLGDSLPVGVPSVMTGSHHDSVPNGGSLDGALGVIAGIEALTCIREQGYASKLRHPLEVVNFTDEEGRFGGMLGSMCLAGKLGAQQILTMASADGERAARLLALHARESPKDGAPSEAEELHAAERATSASRDRDGSQIRPHAFVELHIEQGPVLDEMCETIGVVSGIFGLWKAQLTYRGEANHAGTTPMHMRRNAFAGCAAMQAAIPQVLSEHGGPQTVCTIGSVTLVPNSPNVVPGECTFTVELRDERQSIINAMSAAIRAKAAAFAQEHRLELAELRVMSSMPPAEAHPDVMGCIQGVSADAGFASARVMPSGASHDAMQIATVAPMGMIFVPSIKGISHNPKEATSFEHIVHGANVLLNTLLRLAAGNVEVKPRVTGNQGSGKHDTAAGNGTAGPISAKRARYADANAGEAAASPSSAELRSKASSALESSYPTSPETALLCIDLQQMPPSSARDGVDFDAADQAYFEAHTPALLERVAAVQRHARAMGTAQGSAGMLPMELVHCRIMSMTRDGRDRSALHKRMKIHVPPEEAFAGAECTAGEWMPGVGPKGDELVFNKTGSNAFATTNLHYVLSNLGVRRLVCVGVLTDECVGGTVKTAADLGYEVTVLNDACLAASPERHHVTLQTLSRFATVTTTEDWLRQSASAAP